jgi:hypothetical protein
VIVKVINIPRIAGFEPKDNSPVRADGYRVKSLQPAVQRMQTPPRCIHVCWSARTFERRQDQSQPGRVSRLDSRAGSVQEKGLQTPVAEVSDHLAV